ncbi:MAG TPA: amino acid permease, partial [Candidatus Acidoferrum sp.]|nr:amino acid permease [Candidatus Acidoferrum sp.]
MTANDKDHPMCPKPPPAPVFLRDATGLVREFSLVDSTLMSVGLYTVMYILIWILTVALYAFPGLDVVVTMVLVTILAAFWGLTYGLLGAIMPRAGGDYVWVSRTLHPALAFTNNFPFFIVVLATFWGCGVVIWGSLTFALSAYLDMFGRLVGNASISVLSVAVSAGWLAFILAVVITLINIGINILPRGVYSVVIKALFVVSMLVYIAPIVGFVTTSHAQYVVMFNAFTAKYYGGGTNSTYQGIINLAQSNGWATPSYSIVNSLLAIPVGLLGYSAFQYITYASGEVKRPEKNLSYSMILGLIVGLIATLVLWVPMENTVGYNFMSAAAYLATIGKYPLPTYSVTPFAFVVPIFPDPTVTSITFLSFFIQAGFFCTAPTMLAASRNMFAWSFDRVGPEWLSSIDERTHRPLKALAALGLLVIAGLAVTAFVPWLTTIYNMLWMIFLNGMIVALTAMVFPFIKKDMFNAAPPHARKMIGGIPIITIVGVITFLGMLWAIVACFMNPIISGPTQPSAFSF